MTSPAEPAPMECVTSFVSGLIAASASARHAFDLGGVGAGVLEAAEILRELDGFLRRLTDDPQAPALRGEPRHEPEMALNGEPFLGQHLDHAQAARRVDGVRADLRRPDGSAHDVVRRLVRRHREIGDDEGLGRAGSHRGKVRVRRVQHVDADRFAGRCFFFRRRAGLAKPDCALERDQIGHGEVAPGRLAAVGVDAPARHCIVAFEIVTGALPALTMCGACRIQAALVLRPSERRMTTQRRSRLVSQKPGSGSGVLPATAS